jgi:hypothetical protein
MLGSITRDPIFCSKAQILLQVKNINVGLNPVPVKLSFF